MNVDACEDIVGVTRDGVDKPTDTSQMLRQKGDYWSAHVLEGVRSWIMVFLYILGTVISGVHISGAISPPCHPAAHLRPERAMCIWRRAEVAPRYRLAPQRGCHSKP